MRRLASLLGLALLALASCKSGCASNDAPARNDLQEAPSSVASGTASTSPHGAPAKGDAAAAIANLLYTTPAVVAVSSVVDNPRDFPEHLIDGKPETAWNGKTGELVGGWIAFRVPVDAHVTAVSMSAGFDKRSTSGEDLFSSNYRIARVRISRDGAVLKEVSFDLGKRTPQDVRLEAEGGDFKIEVVDVAKGTREEWKELVVSELAVWGVRGATRLPEAHLPKVRVGSLDAATTVSGDARAKARDGGDASDVAAKVGLDGPYRSLDAFCAKHEAVWKPHFETTKDEYPGFIEGPYCSVLDALLNEKAPSPLLEARLVQTTTHDTEDDHLAVRTKRGWFVTSILTRRDDLRSPGCGGGCSDDAPQIRVSTASASHPLVVEQIHQCWTNPWPGASGEEATTGSRDYVHHTSVCSVADDGTPACRQYVTGRATRPYEAQTFEGDWQDVRKEKLLPSGALVFE